MNEKYLHFKDLWVSYDEQSILLGAVFGVLLFLSTVAHNLLNIEISNLQFALRMLVFGLSFFTSSIIVLGTAALAWLYSITVQCFKQAPFNVILSRNTLVFGFVLVAYLDHTFSDSLL
jgi:hypothetical protein